jgi:hypothetical protein
VGRQPSPAVSTPLVEPPTREVGSGLVGRSPTSVLSEPD